MKDEENLMQGSLFITMMLMVESQCSEMATASLHPCVVACLSTEKRPRIDGEGKQGYVCPGG